MSYYDVDTILTDAQKVPCTFQLDVPGLGYLDGNPGGTVREIYAIRRTALTISRSKQAPKSICLYGLPSCWQSQAGRLHLDM